MTNITASEIKMLYIEIVLIAIIGMFLYFYNQSPITQGSIGVGTGTALVDSSLGLPIGASAILIVSSIFLIPMTIMNIPVLARLVKDFATQWI